MLINGRALSIHWGSKTDTEFVEVGGAHRGIVVKELSVATENGAYLVTVTGENDEKICSSFHSVEARVNWDGKPRVQSQTEWLMWIAEVLGTAQGLAPRGMDQEFRKFWPRGSVPQKLNTPLEPVPQKPNTPQEPVQPSLDGVKTQEHERPLSTVTPQADGDAGGPEGFDVDAGADMFVGVDPAVPEADRSAEVTPPAEKPKAMREIRLPCFGGGNADLAGQDIFVQGQVVRVRRAEIGEENGHEILILTVDQ